MKKTEIKNAKNNDIIVDYIKSYSKLVLNINIRGGTKRLEQHLENLEKELLKREILTQEDIDFLNM